MDREEAKARLRALLPQLMEYGAPLYECSEALAAIRADSPVLHRRLQHLLRELPPTATLPQELRSEAARLVTALEPS